MNSLFEYLDSLQTPYECFLFDTAVENFPIHPHWHYFMEIIYMVEGTAIMNCDDNTFVTEPGDMMLFLPYQVHAIYGVSNQTLKYYVLKFDMGKLSAGAGIHFQSLFRSAKGEKSASLCFRADELNNSQIKWIFEKSREEMYGQQYRYQDMVQSYISTLLIMILREWQKNGFDTEHFQNVDDEDSIYYITEYIDSHMQDNLKVEELAERCHMSYPYFAKCFRELYGQSCKKYIAFIRMCKAEELLISTKLDLNYISQETGFADCSHFIKAFKQKHGITPKQYRKERISSSTQTSIVK